MNQRVPWWGPVSAEFAKLWALRLPRYAYAGVIAYSGLIAFQLFHYERLLQERPGLNALAAMGYLFYGAWAKLIIVPLFLMIFGVYSVAVESQYGMIRIACTQPLSRLRYATAKMFAIALHAAALAAVFCASLLAWSFVFTGLRAGSPREWTPYLLSCGLLMANCMAWACLSASAALFRRTLLGAFVIACGVFILLIWLTIGRPWWFNEYNFLRFYMYPLGPTLPLLLQSRMDLPNMEAPLWHYLLVMFMTPVTLFVPAAIHLHRRDITE